MQRAAEGQAVDDSDDEEIDIFQVRSGTGQSSAPRDPPPTLSASPEVANRTGAAVMHGASLPFGVDAAVPLTQSQMREIESFKPPVARVTRRTEAKRRGGTKKIASLRREPSSFENVNARIAAREKLQEDMVRAQAAAASTRPKPRPKRKAPASDEFDSSRSNRQNFFSNAGTRISTGAVTQPAESQYPSVFAPTNMVGSASTSRLVGWQAPEDEAEY